MSSDDLLRIPFNELGIPGYHHEAVSSLIQSMLGAIDERGEFDEAEVKRTLRAFKRNVHPRPKIYCIKASLFHVAFGLGNLPMAKLFYKLKYGSFCNAHGYFAIHKAVNEGHLECCKLLLQLDKKGLNKRTRGGETPLMLACSNGGRDGIYEIIKLLLENGANPNVCGYKTFSGADTPLLKSVADNNRRLTDLLLSSGADPKFKDSWGQNALHIAVRHKNDEAFLRFLNLGVDIFDLDDSSRTPLMSAIEVGSISAVRNILQLAGSNALRLVNMVCSNGDSCLMHSVYGENSEIMQELIAYGANTSYTTADGRSALTIALDSFRSASFNYQGPEETKKRYLLYARSILPLVTPGVIFQNSVALLGTMAAENAVDLLRFLLDAKVPLETTIKQNPPKKFTALSLAVTCGSLDVIDSLIAAGAKMVYSVDSEFESPFSLALKPPFNIDIIRCFLKHHVELNSKSDDSQHPLPTALVLLLESCDQPLVEEVTTLLLQNGLDPSIDFWCSCNGRFGYAPTRKRRKNHVLLECIETIVSMSNSKLVKILLQFCPTIPGCLENKLYTYGCRPKEKV